VCPTPQQPENAGSGPAILTISAMVGMTLARATAKSAPDLSADILAAVRAQVVEL
jgi:hypothetical protein